MLVKLKNIKRQVDYGVNDIANIDQYDVYNTERQNSGNVRLKFNINTVADGSLFNPITEYITDSGEHRYGISDVDVTTIKPKDAMFGIDIMDTLPIRCLEESYFENASSNNVENYILENTKRNVKTSVPVYYWAYTWEDNQRMKLNSTRSYGYCTYDYSYKEEDERIQDISGVTNDENLFIKSNFLTFDDAVRHKLVNKDGEFGFINPLFMRKLFRDDNGLNKGMIDANAGEFIPLYPSNDLYAFDEVYNKYNSQFEKNWLSYITYPYSSVTTYREGDAADKFIRELHASDKNSVQGKRHGLVIWLLDETRDDITYFRTKTKNGFETGDIVNVYNGQVLELSSVEVVSKPDDYTFGVAMDGKKLFKWYFSPEQVTFDEKEYTVSYGFKNSKITCFYEFSDGTTAESTCNSYNDNLSVVRVENGVECDYYFRRFKALKAKPIVRRNSFAKNIYGINNGCLIVPDDIDINEIHDNLGRPITDLFLTVVKENKGYINWYTDEDVSITSVEMSHSHCFGPVNGGFELDPYLEDENDVKLLKMGKGINVHVENIVSPDESIKGDFVGDLCEYSPSASMEAIIQTFMHRFNTAQRDCLKGDLNISMNSISYDNAEGANIQRYKPLVTRVQNNSMSLDYIKDSLDVGYIYKPHNRIRIRTFLSTIHSSEAENYKVASASSVSSGVYNVSIKSKNNLSLNMPVIMYFKSSSGATHDVMFKAETVEWVEETLLTVKLSDSSDVTHCKECVNGTFVKRNGDKMYLVVENTLAPSYAQFACDGGFYYRWRDVVQNGYDKETSVPTYPFTNNALYVEGTFCIYLRRQRDLIYDKPEGSEFAPVWPKQYGGPYNYVPESIKVETVVPSYKEVNSVKEIDECANIEENLANFLKVT